MVNEQICWSQDGPEYQALKKIAADASVYLCGSAYETLPEFPNLYFQANFIISDIGECILRYRRLISLYTPSPVDVWDKYVAQYGIEAVFPVADTPLGRLACVASEEILYPELCR